MIIRFHRLLNQEIHLYAKKNTRKLSPVKYKKENDNENLRDMGSQKGVLFIQFVASWCYLRIIKY